LDRCGVRQKKVVLLLVREEEMSGGKHRVFRKTSGRGGAPLKKGEKKGKVGELGSPCGFRTKRQKVSVAAH